MRKTTFALVLATSASSTQALTVYKENGTEVGIDGSVRMFLGKDGDDKRGDLKNEGTKINFRAKQDLTDDWSAFVHYQMRFNGGTDNFGDPTTRILAAGFTREGIGELSFGRQDTTADDFLDDAAYYGSADLSPLTDRADKSLRFRSAEWNGFSFGADYIFGDADKTDSSDSRRVDNYKNGFGGVLFYRYALNDDDRNRINAKLLFSRDQYEGRNQTATGLKVDQTGVHLGYEYGAFDIAASYVHFKNKFQGKFRDVAPIIDDLDLDIEGNSKGNYILLDAGYRVIEPSRLYVQWERIDAKADADDITALIKNRYTSGIDYKFTKRTLTYLQYTHERSKFASEPIEKDNIFGIGMRVTFK